MKHCRWLGVVAAMLMGGCTTQAPWVDCDRKLEPINLPAPKPKPAARPASLVREPKKSSHP